MKSALCVWGGWEGHQPKACMEIQAAWLREAGFEVEMSNSLESYADDKKMGSVDLVVQSWTMGQISAEQISGLMKAIKGGVGFAGCHGGVLDAFRDNYDFKFMLGAGFAYHPPEKPIDFQVNITKHDDPITAGVKDFMMSSEPYYLHYDHTIDILATMTFGVNKDAPWIEGAVVPTAWKKTFGKGRVFCCSLGHVPKDFEIPELKTIVQRGMTWAAK